MALSSARRMTVVRLADVDPDFARNRRIYLSYSEDAPQQSPQPDTGDPTAWA